MPPIRYVVSAPYEINDALLARTRVGNLIEVSPDAQDEPGETFEVYLRAGEKAIRSIGTVPYSNAVHARIYGVPLASNAASSSSSSDPPLSAFRSKRFGATTSLSSLPAAPASSSALSSSAPSSSSSSAPSRFRSHRFGATTSLSKVRKANGNAAASSSASSPSSKFARIHPPGAPHNNNTTNNENNEPGPGAAPGPGAPRTWTIARYQFRTFFTGVGATAQVGDTVLVSSGKDPWKKERWRVILRTGERELERVIEPNEDNANSVASEGGQRKRSSHKRSGHTRSHKRSGHTRSRKMKRKGVTRRSK